MNQIDRKNHWEKIYQNKNTDELSWYQPVPGTSLDFVRQLNLPKTAKIVDIGGGDSYFVDHLLDMGYQDITVLDISDKAIEKAKQRLGDSSKKVKWIHADAANFQPPEKYDFWHDRAAFHFLTDETDIEKYVAAANSGIVSMGYLVLGTFSEQGPEKCSGINIRQYSEQKMTDRLKLAFIKTKCVTIDHKTPGGTIQNFIFCCFQRIATN